MIGEYRPVTPKPVSRCLSYLHHTISDKCIVLCTPNFLLSVGYSSTEEIKNETNEIDLDFSRSNVKVM